MKRLGVRITLVTWPLLSIVRFLALGFAPTLGLLAIFQVARRATNFGFTRPRAKSYSRSCGERTNIKPKVFSTPSSIGQAIKSAPGPTVACARSAFN